MNKLFTIFPIICALLVGCSSDNGGGTETDPDPVPELTISSEDSSVTIDSTGRGVVISADKEGLTATLNIVTNVDTWTLSEGAPEWITTSESEENLTITINENESVQSRSAEFTISVKNGSGELEAKLKIAQTGTEAAQLEIEDKNVSILETGGSVAVRYTSNQSAISVIKTDDWLSFTLGDGEIVFSAESNDTNILREAEVTITAGAGDNTVTETVVISQDFRVTFTLSENIVTLPAGGGSYTVSYQTNQSTVTVQNSNAWITVNDADGVMTLSAEANNTDAPLTGEIVVTAGIGDKALTETITVNQDPLIRSFVYVVKTTADGASVALPALTSKDTEIIMNVDYGDGSQEVLTTSTTASMKHTYAAAGEYTVTILTDNVISTFQFYNNTALYKITNNTLDMSGVTTVKQCFYNDTALTEIAANTLSPCVNAKNAEQAFYNCKALTSIPAGLFNGLSQITSFSNIFQNCSSLVTIPVGLFEGYSNITAFRSIFSNTAVTEVPSRLFAGCSSVTSFYYIFSGCASLTKINADAFEGCTAVTDFSSVFTSCTSLTEIPATLFSQMLSLDYLGYTFQHCTGLTSLPASLFDNNRKLIDLEYAFMNCTNLTGESPYTVIGSEKVHIYERVNYPNDFAAPDDTYNTNCFTNDEKLTDYSAIRTNGWAQ